MDTQTKEIYSEVYSILNILGEKYITKLPASLYMLIEKEKLNDYNPQYNLDIALDKQKLKRETLSMIALFHLNYWCDSDEEKNELRDIFKLNEEKKQAELIEKYNPDNLFKKSTSTTIKSNLDNVAIVEYKESFLSKILKRIKNLFKRNK